jgi:hypothetical protein
MTMNSSDRTQIFSAHVERNKFTQMILRKEKTCALAASLPHMRESREVIQPLILKEPDEGEIHRNIQMLLLGME